MDLAEITGIAAAEWGRETNLVLVDKYECEKQLVGFRVFRATCRRNYWASLGGVFPLGFGL
jgi:hypothetical protein